MARRTANGRTASTPGRVRTASVTASGIPGGPPARAAAGGYALPEKVTFQQAVGCDQCAGRGYRGRVGLFELLEMTPAVREAFLAHAPKDEIVALAVKDGMRTLFADGMRKAAEGITTVEEVMRVAAN